MTTILIVDTSSSKTLPNKTGFRRRDTDRGHP